MGFYEELSHYYDVVFPFNPQTYSFLKNEFSAEGNIVDIATGTGNYALAFAKDHFKVTAIDLDTQMIEALKEKSNYTQNHLNPLVMNMLDLNQLDANHFDGAFCIGNSLVHLQTLDDIKKACKEVFNRLNTNGRFLIQIVNYDRILDQNVKELPLIDRKEEGVKFIRKYSLVDGLIHFNTQLVIKNDKTYENTITLFPLRQKELIAILKEVGFKTINCYGGFDKKPFDNKSFPLIVSATK